MIRMKGIVATVLSYLSGAFIWIGLAVLVVIVLLIWFMRRGDSDDDYERERPWETLDGDDESGTFTQTMQGSIAY